MTAVDIDDRGCGVGHAEGARGRADGIEIRTPDVLPGERAEVEIEHVSPHQACAWARLLRRLDAPAPDRVTPDCPAFGRCGGCVWQHLAYESQLARKRGRVVEALRAAGLAAAVDPIIPAPRITGYRNKGKYVVGMGPRGLVLGAYAPRSHAVVDTLGCQVVEPVIDRVAGIARQALAQSRLQPYDERARAGVLRYVIIRSGGDGRVLIGLVTTSRAARAHVLQVAETLAAHAEVAGVVWTRNDATSSVLLTDDSECVAGRPTVVEHISGVAIELGLEDFFQVNRAQAARLYEEAARRYAAYARRYAANARRYAANARYHADSAQQVATADARPVVVDLYCGVGGIAFALAGAGAAVLGVEANASAVRAAQHAAARAGLGDRVRFQVGAAEALARRTDEAIDTIVVNPPRKGLSSVVRAALVTISPSILLYVSCGPASLARDLVALVAAGWRIDQVTPVDLMPGTPQVETLVALSRARSELPA